MVRTVLATFVLLLLWQSQAAACSCVGGNFRETFRAADLVFDGVARATRSIPHPDGGLWDLRLVTTFEVTRAIKGAKRPTVEVSHSPMLGGNCGIEFGIGERVRVVAFGRDGNYSTGYCLMREVILLDEENKEETKAAYRDLLAKVRSKDASERDVEFAAYAYSIKQVREAIDQFIDDYAWKVERLEKLKGGKAGDLAEAEELAAFFKAWRDYEHMELAYAAAARIAPLDPRGVEGRGRALYMQGQYEKARPFFRAALKLNPEQPFARSLLARTRLILEGRVTPGVTDYSHLGAAGLVPSPGFWAGLAGRRFFTLTPPPPPAVSITLRAGRIPGLSLYGSKIDKFFADRKVLTRADFSRVEIEEGAFQGAQLSNANFTAAKVRANFDGARLRNIRAPYGDFSGSSFRRANLGRANAPQSTWTGADLRRVMFANADLTGADLSEAKLQGTDLRRAKTGNITLKGARIDCATRLPAGTDVRKAQIIPVQPICGRTRQNRDFSGRDWSGVDFSRLDLSGANLSNGDFGSVDFSGSNLEKADFSGSDLGNANFLGASLQQANFSNTSDNPWIVYASGDGYAGTDLSGADFSNAKGVGRLNGRDLREYGKKIYPPAKLDRTDFSRAEISLVSFLGFTGDKDAPADITTAIFDGTKISCVRGDSDEAKDILKGEPPESSVAYFHPPDLLAKLPPERREELEKRNEIQRRATEKSRASFEKYVHRQRDMVRQIAKAWPTATFEGCEIYLADPPGAGS